MSIRSKHRGIFEGGSQVLHCFNVEQDLETRIVFRRMAKAAALHYITASYINFFGLLSTALAACHSG